MASRAYAPQPTRVIFRGTGSNTGLIDRITVQELHNRWSPDAEDVIQVIDGGVPRWRREGWPIEGTSPS